MSTLLPLIPEHKHYVEVFAGSAKLLFAKPASDLEVMNDVSGDLINFFRIAKHRPAEMAEAFERDCIHAGRFRELLAEAGQRCEPRKVARFDCFSFFSPCKSCAAPIWSHPPGELEPQL